MADLLQGRVANKADAPPKLSQGWFSDLTGQDTRMQFDAPEYFIGHPVANARKAILQEQGRFDRKSSMALEKFRHRGNRKMFGA